MTENILKYLISTDSLCVYRYYKRLQATTSDITIFAVLFYGIDVLGLIATRSTDGVVKAYERAMFSSYPRHRYVIGWDSLLYLTAANVPTYLCDLMFRLINPRPACTWHVDVPNIQSGCNVKWLGLKKMDVKNIIQVPHVWEKSAEWCCFLVQQLETSVGSYTGRSIS